MTNERPTLSSHPLSDQWLWFAFRHGVLGGVETVAAFSVMTLYVFWSDSFFKSIPKPNVEAAFSSFGHDFWTIFWHHLTHITPVRRFALLMSITLIVNVVYIVVQFIVARWIINKFVLLHVRTKNPEVPTPPRPTADVVDDCSYALTGAVWGRRFLAGIGICAYAAWAWAAWVSAPEIHAHISFRSMFWGAIIIGSVANALYLIRLHEFDPVHLWNEGMSDHERTSWRRRVKREWWRNGSLIDGVTQRYVHAGRRAFSRWAATAIFGLTTLMLAMTLCYGPSSWLSSFCFVTHTLAFLVFLFLDKVLDNFARKRIWPRSGQDREIAAALAFSVLPPRTADVEAWAKAGTIDPLTGVLTRTKFEERARELLTTPDKNEAGAVTAVFVDIDNFKRINTAYGYDGGDRTLQFVGGRLLAFERKFPTGNCVAGRWGGDEFVVLMRMAEESAKGHLQDWLRETRSELGKQIQLKPRTMISLSVGVMQTMRINNPHDAQSTVERIFRQAAEASVEAKAEGKGVVWSFTSADTDDNKRLQDEIQYLLEMAAEWPALSGLATWEATRAARTPSTGKSAVSAKRAARRRLIGLTRRLGKLERALAELEDLQRLDIDSPDLDAERREGIVCLIELANEYAGELRGELRSGLAPVFKEGAESILDQKVDRIYTIIATKDRGDLSEQVVVDLRAALNVVVYTSSLESILENIRRQSQLFARWGSFHEVVESELVRLAQLSDEQGDSRRRPHNVSVLTRKLRHLWTLLPDGRHELDVLARAEGAHSDFEREIAAARDVLSAIETRMDGATPLHCIHCAMSTVSDYLAEVAIVPQLVARLCSKHPKERDRAARLFQSIMKKYMIEWTW